MGKKLIRFDWAIKRLLRNKANFVVLEGFLSELLFDDIKIEQILESEGNQLYEADKFNRVDILTQNSKKELIIIEIQSTYEIDYFQRMAYGVSKSITENLRLGQHYSEMKKVISINIVYFDLGQGKDYIYRGVSDFKGLHQNDLLGLSEKQKSTFMKENVSDIFPEYYLLKVNQFNDIAKDTLDEWIYFLKNSEVKENFKAKGLKEANQVLDIMSLEDKDTYGYNRYLDSLHLKASEIFSLQTEAKFAREEGMKEGREEGMKEGREEGMKEGRKEGMKEIARKLIESGFDNDMIAKTTGLEIVEIEQLRKNK
jgi:predicted transposase/invertase (TIGR01784 family)